MTHPKHSQAVQRELEQKYSVRDLNPLVDRLLQHGARYVATAYETNYILQLQTGLMRLRTDPFQLTFKANMDVVNVDGEEVRSCDEVNYPVSKEAQPAMLAIFKVLPFYTKTRTSYCLKQLDNLKVELDELDKLGQYIELEGLAHRVVEGRILLGLDKSALVPQSYSKMIVDKWVSDGLPFPDFYNFPLNLPFRQKGIKLESLLERKVHDK